MISDTIAAVASAPGRGGIGVVRLSGPKALEIAEKIIRFSPKPRYAHYCDFVSHKQHVIDKGIALYFKAPYSFTGEDVFELQGHGGPVILDLLLKELLHYGARLAEPGEFSERAFLNDKIDLTQAEAIADLIDANSEKAARQAVNSLQGSFSSSINVLLEQLIKLRMYVEAAIDFPEEEVDFLSDNYIGQALIALLSALDDIEHSAKQGVLVREGMKVVIAGKPNAGKSSLLNALTQRETAIVTDIEGTTRDLIKEDIVIDGMPLHIIDTAGLRENPDYVEKIGIAKAWDAIESADRILLLIDASVPIINIEQQWPAFFNNPKLNQKITLVYNKMDRVKDHKNQQDHILYISAKTRQGLDTLKAHLKSVMGFDNTSEGSFSARRRHLTALQKAKESIKQGKEQLIQHSAGELLAQDLRDAQESLNHITGTFTPDDLLGEIFSHFCMGK